VPPAMELTLAMEKAETDKFMALNKAAEDVVDEQLSDYITDTFMDKQVGVFFFLLFPGNSLYSGHISYVHTVSFILLCTLHSASCECNILYSNLLCAP